MPIQILPPVVVRESQQQHSFAHLSRRALRNVYEASVAKRERLVLHRGKLTYWAETEYDFFELVKLGERLDRIDGNLSQLEERIRALRIEMTKRRFREMA